MADTTRDIELRLRARDLSTAELKTVIASVNQLSTALDNQLAAAARLEIKERELRSTLTQLDQAAKNVSGLTAIVERSKLLSEQLERNRKDLDQAADALRRHRDAMEAGTATGKAAESTLAGLESKLKSAQGALDRNSRTLADYTTQLKNAGIEARELATAEQQLATTATQIGNARTKLNETIRELPRLEREAREAVKATAQANRDAAEAAKQKAAAEAAAARAALDSRRAALGSGPTGFREFSQRVDRERQLNALLSQLNRERATDETRQARAVVDAIRKAEQEKTAARVQGAQFNPANPTAVPGQPRTDATGRVNRGAATPRGFLGLRPYEVTNLGYQANDVISGFASGQNPVQILAQQSGQIFQIFTTAAQRYNEEMRAAGQATVNFGAVALRWFPLVAVAVTAVSVAISALATEARTLASNREFTALLTTNKYAADQTAGSLTKLRKELYDLGVSWEDTNNVAKQMLDANILPSAQSQFAKLAEGVAKVNGSDIKTVTTDLIEGLTGGRKAFEDLIAKYPALDREQVNRIRRLYEEGKAGEAHKLALQLLSAEYDKARKEHLSKFDEASENLRKTWHNLLEQLAEKGAFSYLEKVMTFFVQGITNMITTTEAFAKMLESIDKRFPWLKYVALGPVGLAKAAADAAAGLAGGGAPGSVAPGTKTPLGSGIPTEIPEGSRFSTGGLKVDSESLKMLTGMLVKAANELPDGYKVVATSTERPGAVVKRGPNAGQPSEHAFERAIDVKIVDANGRDVPGAMGEGGPLYDKLDKAMATIAAAAGVKLAVGSTFTDPKDAGHYSVGGHEAAVTAGRIPVGASASSADADIVGAQNKKNTALEQEIRSQKEALDIQKARNRTDQEAAFLRQVTAEAQEKSNDKNLQDQYIANKLEERRQQTRSQDFEREASRRKAAEGDKTTADTARAEAAGERAVGEAIKANITNFEQLEAARDKGASEERTRIAKERQDREAFNTLKKQFETDLRSIELKHSSDLEQALEAVNIKYKQRLEAIEKLKDGTKNVSENEINAQKAIVEQLKKREEAEARTGAAIKGAEEALSARGDAIKTINRLEELGEITLGEKEKLTKQAFDSSRQSILDNADALEKSIDPARMSATEVEKLTNKVKLLRAETKYVDPFWKGLKDTFTNSFATGLDTAFSTVSEAIGGAIAKTKEWKDVWTSLKNAAANMIAGLLKDLASYILKAQAAKLASSIFGGTGIGDFFGLAKPAAAAASSATSVAGTAGVTTAGAASTGLFGWGFAGLRAGGVAGRRPATGVGDPSWWAGAPRYRTGTVVGLAPDEQRAILHMGEEVLSADNPRNILNGGGRPGAVNFRAVLVDDQRKMADAMAGAHGEQVIVRHLHRNAATIRDIVRG